MNERILLVEDDANLAFVIEDNLIRKGYAVTRFDNGELAETSIKHFCFDLCILDVMLPKQDGFALARAIRKTDPEIPILFVTAKSMLEDKLEGFKAGGDDYITKPFSMEELCLRIEVFLRRSMQSGEKRSTVRRMGEFKFDFANLTLSHPTGDKTLTQKEADVLNLLCQHKDNVLKREEILRLVWGDDDYFMGRSLDVFISRLRKYLKNDPTVHIVNLHGVGFRLELPDK